MTVVAGFDIHREQVTYDALDDATGEALRRSSTRNRMMAEQRLRLPSPSGRGGRGTVT
ncbi:MAG TPA: hypothetical protein VMG74_08170 [Gaiellaceae bacterium]|nr:hypothetical protein [Gaiellaceae bacterium]